MTKITTVTGSNTFLMAEYVNKVSREFSGKFGDFAVEKIDGEENDLARITEALQNLPFLAEARLVILRNPSANKQFVDQLEVLMSTIPDTNKVIVIEHKLDKRSSYYKFLKKHSELIEFSDLDGPQLTRWLCEEVKTQGGTLSSTDARYIIDRVGTNQQLLANELQKLITYDPHVTKATIEKLTVKSPQSSIFDLIEAAFSHNTQTALQLYEEQRLLKVEPLQIIAMLAWQLNILTIIKTAQGKSSAQIAADAKLNPYVVSRSSTIADSIYYAKLKEYVEDLFNLDIKSKTESINIDDALRAYIVGLSS